MTSYIQPVLGPVDPDELADAAHDFLADNIDGYIPNDNSLASWLIMALARMTSTATVVASTVPTTDYQYFGSTIIGLLPETAVAALTTTTWTMRDDAGYTIPAGTNVAFQPTGDTMVFFITTDDVVVPPGSTTTAVGAVQIQAVEAGAAANDLDPSTLTLVDPLDFVAGVVAVTAPSGGADGETDDAYIQRLTDEFQLFTPTPILGKDAGVLARNIEGVWRAVGVDNYDPGYGPPSNPVASAPSTVGGNLQGGYTYTFAVTTITGAGESTPLTWKYTPPSGTNTNQVTFSWTPPTADPDLDAITGYRYYRDDPTFPGELRSSHASTVAPNHVFSGGAIGGAFHPPAIDSTDKTGRERMIAVACVDGSGDPISAALKAQVKAYLEDMRELNFVLHVFDAAYTNVDVTYTFTPFEGYDPADVLAAANAALGAYLNPAGWGVTPGDLTLRSWENNTKVRLGEVYSVLMAVPGLRWVNTLTLNGAAADVVLAGVVTLPRPGVLNGAAA